VAKNVSVRVPMSVSVRMVADDELKKMQDEVEVAMAARKKAIAEAQERRAKEEAEEKKEMMDLPDGTEQSDLAGAENGRRFLKVDPDHKPLVGLRFKTGDWMGQRCFKSIDPIFATDKAPEKVEGETVVMAKDGYAVGAIVVNAKERVNSLAVTFMKKTDTGLDPKTSYNTPWYGKAQGAERKKLGADGRFIYGICGVKIPISTAWAW